MISLPWSLTTLTSPLSSRPVHFMSPPCLHLTGLDYQLESFLTVTHPAVSFFEVNVILNLTHLPPFPEYTLDLGCFPRGRGPMRPISMEGLVIAVTRVTKYTQGARFLCINEDCPCSTGTAQGQRHFLTSALSF